MDNDNKLLPNPPFVYQRILAIVGLLLLAPAALAADNDYPTETRVDYVIGCMAANGQDYLTMQKCSCSIDAIAERIPYEEYEAAETMMRMHDQRGELGMLFRTEHGMEEQLKAFRSAQAEADLQCF